MIINFLKFLAEKINFVVVDCDAWFKIYNNDIGLFGPLGGRWWIMKYNISTLSSCWGVNYDFFSHKPFVFNIFIYITRQNFLFPGSQNRVWNGEQSTILKFTNYFVTKGLTLWRILTATLVRSLVVVYYG